MILFKFKLSVQAIRVSVGVSDVMAGQVQKPRTLQARIVAGSVILLSGSGLTTAINLAYNIAVARSLGPKGFGHATAVYTILTLISAVTLSLQIICAKFVAQASSPEEKFAVYRGFHAGGWICGILIGAGLLLYQTAITNYLKLPARSLLPCSPSEQHFMFRWEAGEDLPKGLTASVAWPKILFWKARCDWVDLSF